MHSWRVTRPAIVLEKLWHIRRDLREKNNGTENVDQPLVNSQVEEMLSITDILKEMSDRQSLLTEDLKKNKIHPNLLHNIQKELLKEWKIKATSSGQKTPEEEIINLTIDTTRKLGLYNNTFEEKDLQFMLKIGWKLAQYNIGLPQKLEADDRYPAIKAEMVKQSASISSEKVDNAMTAYLSFSFGMNSGYLFYSYLLATSKMKMPSGNKLSPSKIKYARDAGLKSLLSYIQRLVEDDSQGAVAK